MVCEKAGKWESVQKMAVMVGQRTRLKRLSEADLGIRVE